MKVEHLQISNGIVSGIISISKELAREHRGRNVVCMRARDSVYRSVGTVDHIHIGMVKITDLFLDKQLDFQLYIAWNEAPKEFIGTLRREDIEDALTSHERVSVQGQEKAWWEFGQIDESAFMSLFMLPFRLIINIVVFALKIPLQIVKLILQIFASFIVILISVLILFPIKLCGLILSFGYWNGFKNRFLGYLNNIWEI